MEVKLISGKAFFDPVLSEGGIGTYMGNRVTGPRMGYQKGLLGHAVGILRAQSTVGLDENFEYF
eukprot:12934835-Prorocentrum_lima.AAC.1